MANHESGSQRERLNVLFLEGYCMFTDPSYLERGNPADIWGAPDAIQEIESGMYHAIVVVDCAYNEAEFFETFGSHLQKFVEHGGVVAFPTSESGLVHKLGSLFGVSWKRQEYFRTTWGPCEENMNIVHRNFGHGQSGSRIIQPYSVKGNTLCNVPPHERCFGVTKDSKTQSLVPFMSGRDVGSNSELDPGIIVAVHDYGMGCISYLGDVNCEDQTVQLVAALILSRSPEMPIDCWTTPLVDEIFYQALKAKEEGNDLFKNGNLEGAFVSYQSAIAKYEGKRGSPGEQRDILIALHSNSGLVAGKLKKWDKSAACASQALELDPKHSKSLYRRALARYHMSQSDGMTAYNALKLVRQARKDLIKIPSAEPATEKDKNKLLQRLDHETKRLEKLDKKKNKEGNFGEGLKLNANNFRF